MKIYPIINPDFDEQVLESSTENLILPNGDSVDSVDMSGWMTEDGVTIYMEDTPRFHPITGEPLEYAG